MKVNAKEHEICHLLCVRISKQGKLFQLWSSVALFYFPFYIFYILHELPITVITNHHKPGQSPQMGLCWAHLQVWAGLHSFRRLRGRICVLAFFSS